MMGVTKYLKARMREEVELSEASWRQGTQENHRLPRAARLFPKLSLPPCCPTEGWVLAIPVALMQWQNALLPEAWPRGVPEPCRSRLGGLTPHTGLSQPHLGLLCPCVQHACEYMSHVNICVWLRKANNMEGHEI